MLKKTQNRHGKAWGPKEDDTVVSMRGEGISWENIGLVLGRGAAACRKRAEYLGLFQPKYVNYGKRKTVNTGPKKKCANCDTEFHVTPERRMLCKPCFKSGGAEDHRCFL